MLVNTRILGYVLNALARDCTNGFVPHPVIRGTRAASLAAATRYYGTEIDNPDRFDTVYDDPGCGYCDEEPSPALHCLNDKIYARLVKSIA
jgi:hypothetical protein